MDLQNKYRPCGHAEGYKGTLIPTIPPNIALSLYDNGTASSRRRPRAKTAHIERGLAKNRQTSTIQCATCAPMPLRQTTNTSKVLPHE
jgi:hypothetical protein